MKSRLCRPRHGEDYTYDADGLLTGSSAFSLTRDPQSGNVTRFYFDPPAGTWSPANPYANQTYSYDSYGALAQQTANLANSNTAYSETLTRDNQGRIITQVESSPSYGTHESAYSFDAAGRLVQVRTDGNLSSSYTYDSNSNRVTEEIPQARS
jgi:YD repeat-containing protein